MISGLATNLYQHTCYAGDACIQNVVNMTISSCTLIYFLYLAQFFLINFSLHVIRRLFFVNFLSTYQWQNEYKTIHAAKPSFHLTTITIFIAYECKSAINWIFKEHDSKICKIWIWFYAIQDSIWFCVQVYILMFNLRWIFYAFS